MPHESPLPGGYTPGSVEGNMKLNELTDLCTKLVDRVTSLEKELKQTKEVHGKAFTKLVKKVKKLEDMLKYTTKRRKAKVVLSEDEENLVLEVSSKQGRMTETAYEDIKARYAEVEYDLDQTDQHITPTKDLQSEEQSQEAFEAELSFLSTAKILAEASKERVKTYNKRKRSTDSSKVSTATGLFSTAEETDEEFTRKVQKEEQTKALEQQEQERINLEAAQELQQQLDERHTDDINWNSIVKQVQETQSGSMIRYQTLKKKPVSVAQARKNMMVYLKNMAGYKINYFKGMSYDQIRPIFEQEYNKVQTLFKKDTDVVKTKPKRVAEETLLQESFKKLRTTQASSSEPVQEQSTNRIKKTNCIGQELKRCVSEDSSKILYEIGLKDLNTKYLNIDCGQISYTKSARK
ncbi:hypothetical protein Tco_1015539 [Tanacetum coccineum]|uniref:Uncharacterized protein n=1 Tax=Tanacetum coccineum TaxID=301880 RepID=A0ABQ5FLQ9_9ASTR